MAYRWGLAPTLVQKIIQAQGDLDPRIELWIFSGIRDRAHHENISSTPFELSTHADTDARGCARLATGADVQPMNPALRIDDLSAAQMGAAMTRSGLRWGGGAPFDDRGIPVGNERWHVDLGSRSS